MGKHSYSARHDDLVQLTRNELVEQVGEDHEEINEQGMVDKCQQTEDILIEKWVGDSCHLPSANPVVGPATLWY